MNEVSMTRSFEGRPKSVTKASNGTNRYSHGIDHAAKVFSDLFRQRHVKYYARSQNCALISVIERKRVVARRRKCANTISSTRRVRPPFWGIPWHATVPHYKTTSYNTETIITIDNGPTEAMSAKGKATRCAITYYDCNAHQSACRGVL